MRGEEMTDGFRLESVSMVITVPDEIAAVLQRVADERGVSAEQVAVEELGRLRSSGGLSPAAKARVVTSIESHRGILDRLGQ
jgi:hypothetical protein